MGPHQHATNCSSTWWRCLKRSPFAFSARIDPGYPTFVFLVLKLFSYLVHTSCISYLVYVISSKFFQLDQPSYCDCVSKFCCTSRNSALLRHFVDAFSDVFVMQFYPINFNNFEACFLFNTHGVEPSHRHSFIENFFHYRITYHPDLLRATFVLLNLKK